MLDSQSHSYQSLPCHCCFQLQAISNCGAGCVESAPTDKKGSLGIVFVKKVEKILGINIRSVIKCQSHHAVHSAILNAPSVDSSIGDASKHRSGYGASRSTLRDGIGVTSRSILELAVGSCAVIRGSSAISVENQQRILHGIWQVSPCGRATVTSITVSDPRTTGRGHPALNMSSLRMAPCLYCCGMSTKGFRKDVACLELLQEFAPSHNLGQANMNIPLGVCVDQCWQRGQQQSGRTHS